MEYIQTERSNKCITHRILLIEVTSYCARLFVPPSTPFINHQPDPFLWIIFIHDSDMLLNDLFNLKTFS